MRLTVYLVDVFTCVVKRALRGRKTDLRGKKTLFWALGGRKNFFFPREEKALLRVIPLYGGNALFFPP
jgi:hypothetical protein